MSNGCCACNSPNAGTCGGEGNTKNAKETWIVGYKTTNAGAIPLVSTELKFADTCGAWKARWGIGRMDYAIDPGLYCVGNPDEQSNVLVTANYKMTFDRLRCELTGMDVWILVLDTKGINVWCAAGKGTFGTDELVNRIALTQLGSIVAHRNLILPQLGASGVKAHEVLKQSGFRVNYGPVRAKDIKEYINNDMKATDEMREVKFTAIDRLVLTPMEIVGAIKPTIIVLGVLFIINAIGLGHYGLVDLYAYLGAIFLGCVLAPVLLPFIPGRAFSFKGMLLGIIWAVGVGLLNGWPDSAQYGWLKAIAYLLILPAVSAYCCMNFTGASTYTSLSGVDREMKFALPAMILALFFGAVLLLINDFLLI